MRLITQQKLGICNLPNICRILCLYTNRVRLLQTYATKVRLILRKQHHERWFLTGPHLRALRDRKVGDLCSRKNCWLYATSITEETYVCGYQLALESRFATKFCLSCLTTS